MKITKKNKGVDSYGCGLILREGENENIDRSLWDRIRGLPSVRRKLTNGDYIVESEIADTDGVDVSKQRRKRGVFTKKEEPESEEGGEE